MKYIKYSVVALVLLLPISFTAFGEEAKTGNETGCEIGHDADSRGSAA